MMKDTNIALVSTIAIMSGFALYNAIQKRRDTAPIHVVKNMSNGYNARVIPPLGIYVSEKEQDNEALIKHEMTHWNQYQRLGLVDYYLKYASQMKKFGYDKMPMEVEARGNESEYCQKHYENPSQENPSLLRAFRHGMNWLTLGFKFREIFKK
jgi:hypothetical protein